LNFLDKYMVTEERLRKIKEVLNFRQPDLRVVIERIENQHNASAILRTCDAVGIIDIDIILPKSGSFPISPSVTTGAEKWLRLNYYDSTEDCIEKLKKECFKIACTYSDKDSIKPWEIDLSGKIAIIFGNEKEGVSETALSLSDFKIWIPMFGMVRSLNVSVSAGMILYEALKQRYFKREYGKQKFSEEEFSQILKLWCGEI